MKFVRIFSGFPAEGATNRSGAATLVIFHLMQSQRHFSDMLRCVAIYNIIIMKALDDFLISQRQVILKDACGYVMLESFISHVCLTPMSVALSELTS